MARYRVRGIYATAIAKLLLDSGEELVDLSRQLASRFGMEQRAEIPPDATIKVSEEDPSTLVVIGFREAVERALEILETSVPFIITKVWEHGPYTSVKGRILGVRDGRCIVETPIGVGEVVGLEECVEGSETWVHVVRVGDRPVFRRGLACVGRTLVVVDDGMSRVTFSEHIRSYERRAELVTLAQEATRRGLSVRWRSAARSAPIDTILEDLKKGIEKVEQARSSNEVVEGESIAFVRFTRCSKEILDDIRRLVLPTTPLHHTLKSSWRSDVVDVLDVMSSAIPLDYMKRGVLKLLISRALENRFLEIVHRKPSGETYVLGRAEVVGSISNDVVGESIVLKRTMKSNGVYDGLGVEKEAGDIAMSIVPLDGWTVVHLYTSKKGEIKGMYININTPPELVDGGRIEYIDLVVDVACINGECRVIDLEELEKSVKEDAIPPDLYAVAKDIANSVVARSRDYWMSTIDVFNRFRESLITE